VAAAYWIRVCCGDVGAAGPETMKQSAGDRSASRVLAAQGMMASGKCFPHTADALKLSARTTLSTSRSSFTAR